MKMKIFLPTSAKRPSYVRGSRDILPQKTFENVHVNGASLDHPNYVLPQLSAYSIFYTSARLFFRGRRAARECAMTLTQTFLPGRSRMAMMIPHLMGESL